MNQPIGRRVLPVVTGCFVLITLGMVTARAQDGVAPQRPTLGISVADVSELTRRRYGVVVASGAVISQIREGSPAALAGLPLGGVIVSLNGKRIGSANDLVEMIQVFRPGEQVEVTYFEGDRIGRKTIRLGGAPAVAAVPPPAREAAPVVPEDPPLRLGRRSGGDRPILDALERTLGRIMPPAEAPGGPEPRPAPDPPLEGVPPIEFELPPPPTLDAARDESPDEPAVDEPAVDEPDELTQLRVQLEQIERQLETLRRRIEQLERARAAGS